MRRYNSYVNVKDEVNAKANGNGCPVPKGGTGRYKVKGTSTARSRRDAGATKVKGWRSKDRRYKFNCFDSLRNLFARI